MTVVPNQLHHNSGKWFFCLLCRSANQSQLVGLAEKFFRDQNLSYRDLSPDIWMPLPTEEDATLLSNTINASAASLSNAHQWQVEGVLPQQFNVMLLQWSQRHKVDLVCLPLSVATTPRKLAVFDMDSTLIQQEMIDELAVASGCAEEVAGITRQAMEGKLDFRASLTKRVSLLQGLSSSALEEVATKMTVTDGAVSLFRLLKKLGCYTAILSGGFDVFAQKLQHILNADVAHANQLEVQQGKLSGRVCGDILDGERKLELMQNIAQDLNLPMTQVMAVGDGANDLPMISHAGVGVAFYAKTTVEKQAPIAIRYQSLNALSYLLGYGATSVATVLR